MMANFIVVFLLSFSITFAVDPCRFEYPGKGVIDLTTVAHSDGTAAFPDVIPASSPHFKYSYNPCKPFKGPDVCENVAACQVAVEGGSAISLGPQTSASWSPGDETSEYPSISYYQGERKTIVILKCSTSGETIFQVVGEDPPLVYLFILTHKCACWDGCSSTPSTTPSTTPQPITDECRFVHPEKGIIDFSFIGRTDEKAAYSDESTRTSSNFKYSYNPCRSFSQGSGCIGAAVCQVSNDGQETFTLGTQESAWWNVSTDVNSVSSLNYIYANKKVSVLLQCSTEGNNEFQAFGENPVNTFKFQLTHRCVCWNACSFS